MLAGLTDKQTKIATDAVDAALGAIVQEAFGRLVNSMDCGEDLAVDAFTDRVKNALQAHADAMGVLKEDSD